jgi:hypothetical protein
MTRWGLGLLVPVGIALGLATGAAAIDRPSPLSGLSRTPAGVPVLQGVPSLRVDRRYVPLAPGYPRPPRGFVPLPRSGAPLLFPTEVPGQPDRVWVPGRTELAVGLDGRGRLIHVLEHTPGHFAP